jgi:glycine cleavage system H protein
MATASELRYDDSCHYTKTSEWVRPLDDSKAVVGLTDYAQDQLSDIVYVELPEVGDMFEQSEAYAVAESVKATSDCYLPLGGEITAVNEELEASPQLVNEDPYGEGWFVEFVMSDPAELDGLMDAIAYEAFVAGELAKGEQ